jgi:cobalt-precorrin-5B (C1)-methyltransferase
LLALTGVQTIGKLAPFWQKHLCWFRVLDREESLQLAVKQGFPAERVLFYQPGGDESEVLNRLHPQAIITKESGASGGFNEKIEAARQAGVKVFVVKRPELSPTFGW